MTETNESPRDELEDRLLEQSLREVLKGESPPDLTERITMALEVECKETICERDSQGEHPTRRFRWVWTVVGIAATLLIAVGLLLPSVQSARESARRMASNNNTRQLGLATHNYHDVHKNLPAMRAGTSEIYKQLDTSAGIAAAHDSRDDPSVPRTRLERKVVYNASFAFAVTDFDNISERVTSLVETHDALIARSTLDADPGRPRSQTWTVRVPVARYGAFVEAIGSLGELQSKNEESREVTAEYFDLETRIRNKRVEEERLLKHLAESTGKLDEILTVEREISRVRTEIEQFEGQFQVLQDVIALSTVTLTASELQSFIPPDSPSFGIEVQRAWSGTITTVVDVLKGIVLIAVAATPWCLVIGPPVIVIGWLWRRMRRGTGRRPRTDQ